jgi:hypothetical protein
MKLEQSDAVSSGLKKQLQEREEFLNSNVDKQKQLQTTIDGLTKTVESLNQRLQVLCEPPEFVSTFNIPALTVRSLKYLAVSGVLRGGGFGGSNPLPRNSEVFPKLSRIPSSVEYTPVTT